HHTGYPANPNAMGFAEESLGEGQNSHGEFWGGGTPSPVRVAMDTRGGFAMTAFGFAATLLR
ncbi:hypothetical protein, partial [Parvibaculum sp.]|uniref:hypothetical protein n=1 Tax=Parvibaculum sp. TaxID=2024848 RepID=UPI0038B3E257